MKMLLACDSCSDQGRRKKKNLTDRVQAEVLLRQNEQCANFREETGTQLHRKGQLCFQSYTRGSLSGKDWATLHFIAVAMLRGITFLLSLSDKKAVW